MIPITITYIVFFNINKFFLKQVDKVALSLYNGTYFPPFPYPSLSVISLTTLSITYHFLPLRSNPFYP